MKVVQQWDCCCHVIELGGLMPLMTPMTTQDHLGDNTRVLFSFPILLVLFFSDRRPKQVTGERKGALGEWGGGVALPA